MFTLVTDQVVPASLGSEDPHLSFYSQILRFTDEETQQEMENAIQHFKMQFGLDFSNIQPNDANQWVLGNSTLSPVLSPVNSTLVFNNWMRKKESQSAFQ